MTLDQSFTISDFSAAAGYTAAGGQRLAARELAAHCDPAMLEFDPAHTDHDDERAPRIVGQDRARAAVDFGIAMQHEGYHVFIMGPSGTGKRSLARQAIDAFVARDGAVRYDWVYVNNFDSAHRPVALRMAAGRGAKFRADMRALVDELRTTIPAAFESEEYVAELERLNTDFKDRAAHGLLEVGEEARKRELVMLRTPAGFTFAPQKNNDVMSAQDFEALPQEQRTQLEKAVGELQERLLHVLRASMRLRKEHADKLRTLNRSTTKLAVDQVVDETKALYADVPAVGTYLEAVRAAITENADAFRAQEDGEAAMAQASALAPYEVNLVVDAGGSDGAPIVDADLPSYQNLVGRVDHTAHFGMLVTDFRHIKAGLLHRANGGYLLVDAVKLLTQPFAWDTLKRALLRSEIRIESMAEMFSMASTTQLEPEPIPLKIKVLLLGEREIHHLLQAHDPEFEQLFRVVADLGDDLPRDQDTQRSLARTLAAQMRACNLLAPSASALARLIDHGARRSGDATRISAAVRRLLDIMHEADFLARAASRARIEAGDVAAACMARRERASRVDERMRDATRREIIAIATSGGCVGQVNGLAAYEVSGEAFGMPTRITATTRLGDGQVVDIQRETRMAGPLHAKGVLILASFLASRYSRFQPYSIIGSVAFEQTYGSIEGDSASLAELVALLASIGDVAVLQSLAVTGSVDQLGNVQAIGAVNEKIEGFFDLCAARGLDGTHGVVVPASNAPQLMLREDVVQAVADRRFAVYAVRTVDEAIEVLTGLSAGDATVPRDDTVNGRIAKRLREYSMLRRGESRFVRRKTTRAVRVTVPRDEP